MSFDARVLRVLIASPSDCREERELVPRIMQMWNGLHGFDSKTVLLPVRWEDDAYASIGGDRPQEVINKQIVRDADILVGFFWTRLGTATGKAESGSVEEINEFLAAGKPVLLYFSEQPVQLKSIDKEQYDSLVNFRASLQPKGLTLGMTTCINCASSFRHIC